MTTAAEKAASETVDHLFRRHAGQMVAVLSRIFGLGKLELIEDAVQDALIAALKNWPFSGFPENPQAWLVQVSKNKILDRIRRDRRLSELNERDPALAGFMEMPAEDTIYFRREVSGDQLRMIFACCHPAIAPDAQVALTLKTTGGFSVAEIASAFLAKNEAVARMLSRAKQKLRESLVTLEIPGPEAIPTRLDAVLKVLYLMFNEGYTASEGDALVRRDLCFEAIRLCELLAAHPMTRTPRTHALAALFQFQSARLASRHDELGDLILLSEQDPRLWDQTRIQRALYHFGLSASGDELSDYHLEAEIAACHSLAPDFKSTEWKRILDCYDMLQARTFSPVVELNRSIVLGKLNGPENGLGELEKLRDSLDGYYLFHAARAHFLDESGEKQAATEEYELARSITKNEPVRRFLTKKIVNLLSEGP
jgi:RNA polymerase sigma factor (sigma-70 family)